MHYVFVIILVKRLRHTNLELGNFAYVDCEIYKNVLLVCPGLRDEWMNELKNEQTN